MLFWHANHYSVQSEPLTRLTWGGTESGLQLVRSRVANAANDWLLIGSVRGTLIGRLGDIKRWRSLFRTRSGARARLRDARLAWERAVNAQRFTSRRAVTEAHSKSTGCCNAAGVFRGCDVWLVCLLVTSFNPSSLLFRSTFSRLLLTYSEW